MKSETKSRIVVGVVCFLLGVASMWPPQGIVLATVFPDSYERWVCPAENDTTCEDAGLEFKPPASRSK